MKTYLFDFDGTLVDSMPTSINVMKSILDDTKIPYGDDLIKIITSLWYNGTADYYISLGLGGTKDEIIDLMNRCAKKNTPSISALRKT